MHQSSFNPFSCKKERRKKRRVSGIAVRTGIHTEHWDSYQCRGWGGAPPAPRRCRPGSGSCRPAAGTHLEPSCRLGSPRLYRPHPRSTPSLSESTHTHTRGMMGICVHDSSKGHVFRNTYEAWSCCQEIAFAEKGKTKAETTTDHQLQLPP